MAKYKIMFLYTYIFFTVSMSLIILGCNLTYEVKSQRYEKPPANAQMTRWPVQRVTKGLPPMTIATQTEWREGDTKDYATTYERKIHVGNIVGVVGFSAAMSAILVFIGGFIVSILSKIAFPELPIPKRKRKKWY